MFDLILIILTDMLNYIPLLVAFLLLMDIFYHAVWGK